MQTVYTLEPITKEAKIWVGENVQAEPYQWLGSNLVIEHRYIADIVAGMIEEGFLPNKDFRVS